MKIRLHEHGLMLEIDTGAMSIRQIISWEEMKATKDFKMLFEQHFEMLQTGLKSHILREAGEHYGMVDYLAADQLEMAKKFIEARAAED